MSDALNLKFSGLYTSGNPFSSAPDGSFETADNVVLRNWNVVEPRRGYSSTAVNPSGSISRVFAANGKIYAFASNGDLRTYTTGVGWSSAFTDSTVSSHFLPVDSNNPIRGAMSNKSFFFTTTKGVKCSDSPTTGTVALAGLESVPFGQTSALLGSTGATFLPTSSSVAYYVVLCYYDANNNLVQSAPSSRLVVTNNGITGTIMTIAAGQASYTDSGGIGAAFILINTPSPHGLVGSNYCNIVYNQGAQPFIDGSYFMATNTATSLIYPWSDFFGSQVTNVLSTLTLPGSSGPANVTVSAQLPFVGASRATFAQLYRSATVGSGLTPSDECFLVQEHVITSAERTAGVFTFAADGTPDSFLTVPLYTNSLTGGSIAVANDLPPLARELCPYNNRLLYANTQEHHSVALSLIGTSGIVSGTSSLVINGVTYLASSVENAAASPPTFLFANSGTAAQNIDAMARSLCRVITQYNYAHTGPITADYISTANDSPGQMVIREAGFGGSSFTLNAGQDGQTCWSPDLSKASYVQTSTNNLRPNRIWYSNDGEPWGVPADNWIEPGAADQDILRCILVRSTVFIFKKDGLWTLQGDTPDNYDLRPFDPSLVLLAPETAAVVNNQIFCMTNRGVVYVSESGVSPPVSEPIERTVFTIASQYTQYPTTAFGVAYENENLYLCAVPQNAVETTASHQYAFNLDPTGWTRWKIGAAQHGVFDPLAQGLVWAVGSKLYLERKNALSSDFQNPDGTAISCMLRTTPIAVGNPLVEKIFRTMLFSFQTAEFTTCTVSYDTDATGTGGTITKAGPGAGAGTEPFGGLPFGVSSRGFIMRSDLTQAAGTATQLSVSLAISETQRFWRLQGISALFESASETPRRG